MPVPNYNDSKEDLINALRASTGYTSREFAIAKAILDIKSQEDVADQTKKLSTATWILALATIGLVVATIVLVVVTMKS